MTRLHFVKNKKSIEITGLPEFFIDKILLTMKLDEFISHLKELTSKEEVNHNILVTPIIKDGFFIRQNNSLNKILFKDILWIEAARNYLYIHLSGKKKIIITHPLSYIEPYLSPINFKRVHRSFIVNINHVSSFCGNMVCIREKRIPISKQYRKSFKAYFVFLK